jgi:hypothetical protein
MPDAPVSTTMCWWCQERPATTGEHKFKRSDLAREHGRGELVGAHQLVHYGGASPRHLKSTKSKPLKFKPSLCAACNNTRSQPHDQAYDRFIGWVLDHEDEVLDSRSINLEAALGDHWRDTSLDVLRYWGKHIGCRLHEDDPEHFFDRLPDGLIAFMDGGPFPQGFSFELCIEPAWLRFCEHRRTDPLWVRNLNYEPLYGPASPTDDDRTEAIWRYGWLTLGWGFGGDTQDHNPFEHARAPLPIWAYDSAQQELMFGGLRQHRARSEAEAQAALEAVTGGGPIDPDQVLEQSPIAEAFTGGMLDFEAGVRNRRETPLQARIDEEIFRAALIVEIATSVWGFGRLDVAGVRAVEAPTELTHDVLRAVVGVLGERAERAAGFEATAAHLAQMSALKLLEGITVGVGPESDRAVDGQEALRDAAEFAGRAAGAAGAVSGTKPGLWDSVNAALARLARLE